MLAFESVAAPEFIVRFPPVALNVRDDVVALPGAIVMLVDVTAPVRLTFGVDKANAAADALVIVLIPAREVVPPELEVVCVVPIYPSPLVANALHSGSPDVELYVNKYPSVDGTASADNVPGVPVAEA